MLSGSEDSKYCFRSPGAQAPALAFSQSFWALTERDIPIEASLERACSEGFSYFEIGLREDRLAAAEVLLNRFPLKLIAQGWARTFSEVEIFFDRARRLGAIAFNIHLGHAYMTADEAVGLLAQVQEYAETFHLPLLLETHRGRLTQDLFRTAEVLARLPKTIIALDVSHYIVAGETLGGAEELFHHHMLPLIARTALVHGRISNGQSIQVSTVDPFASTAVIESLWSSAMSLWLEDAPCDAVFVFEPELGPPPYAYVDRTGVETFSRSLETGKLIEIARAAWSKAQDNASKTDLAAQSSSN